MLELTSEKARVFRITHIANIAWILAHGIHCKNSSIQDLNFVQIGNPDLIDKRSRRPVLVPPHGMLNDYVPFYFTPFSPMLLNIKTGWNGIQQRPMQDIVILVSSIHRLAENDLRVVVTDRHAYLEAAMFSDAIDGLKRIDWKLLQSRNFKRDPNDLAKIERYQAEALVSGCVPVDALTGIVCHGPQQEALLSDVVVSAGLMTTVVARPGWFF